MKFVLEGERPISWNKFYSGMHWAVRKDEADKVHWLMEVEILNMAYDGYVEVAQERVDIHITAYFDKRPLDPDNICAKLYVDGLVPNIIENDTRQYVRKVTVQSEIDRDNPRVEIELKEVQDD